MIQVLWKKRRGNGIRLKKAVLLAVLAMLAFCLPSCAPKAETEIETEAAAEPLVIENPEPFNHFELTMFNEFILVHENELAELWADTEFSNFRVVSKETGAYYDTKQMEGSEGNELMQNTQKSDFTFNYLTSRVNASTKMLDNYSMSINFYQVEYERIENGVRCYYLLGEKDKLQVSLFPYFITMERLEELVLQYLDEDQRDEMLDNFYNVTTTRVVRRWAPYNAEGNPTIVPPLALGRMYQYFYEIGKYTPEELAKDNLEWGQESVASETFFRFTMEYTLDGKDLLVRMPMDEILTADAYPINEVTLTPYLLSGSAEDEGYLFVPDGSGGLIHFNEGDPMAPVMQIPLYGDDPLRAPYFYKETFSPATLPVVGMKKNDIALLGIVEEGAELATVSANIAGKMDEYNKVNVSFNIIYIERLLMTSAGSTAPKYLGNVYDGDLTMRYIFLENDQANYTGMAKAYKDYLTERGGIKQNEAPADAPLFVEFPASAPQEKMFLGFPVTQYEAATSTQQAENILKDLQAQGVKGVQAQYSAWANNGVKNDPLTRVKTLDAVGGDAGIKALAAYAAENGVGFYPSVNIVSARKKTWGGLNGAGLTPNVDYARLIDNDYAPKMFFDVANRMGHLTGEMLIIPTRLPSYAQTASDNLLKLGLNGLGVADAGTALYGTYGQQVQLMRSDATSYMEETLQTLSGSGLDLLFSNANAYAFPYASVITDLPATGSGRRAITRAIPFVQMVLENDIPYSMPAYNADMMSWDGFEEYLLKAVETRSSLKFIFTEGPELMFQSALKKSNGEFVSYYQPFYYMTQYSRWADTIGEYYRQYNDFYRQTAGAEITEHVLLENGLVSVTYSNGLRVLINYDAAEKTEGGASVPGQSFIIATH